METSIAENILAYRKLADFLMERQLAQEEHMDNEKYMKRCYELAIQAGKKGYDTFGALLVHDGEILEEAENTADWNKGIFGHAEFNLVHKCANRYSDHVLKESTLYTSCAPCERCLCAIASLGVENVVFGVSYEEFSKLTPNDPVLIDREGLLQKLGIRMKLTGPVLEDEGMHVFEWWGGEYRPLEELIAEMAEVRKAREHTESGDVIQAGIQLRTPNVVPINDHVWLLDDNHEATCYVVAGTKQAAVIDTSIGLCNIREAAESLTSLPLICINTHGHEDHMGGNWSFEKAYMNLADLPLAEDWIKKPEVQEAMKQFGASYPPFEHIEDGHIFDLGGIELEVIYLPGHTAGEIVLLDKKDRILFSGDGIIQHLWLQLDESLPVRTQIQSMERMLPLRNTFDMILNGHIQTPCGAEMFDTLLKALKDLEAGNTADDIDYEWLGNVSKAHPYQPEDRRIVYKEQRTGDSE